MEFLRFKHARFSARFPRDYRYSASHYWMAPEGEMPGLWRVGFTKFATRMLGELVEATFDLPLGTKIAAGEEIGAVEGFKAASSVFSVIDGTFEGLNPVIEADACVVKSDPYEVGWLYRARGEPEEGNLDAEGYLRLLEATITRMAAMEHGESGA